MSSTMSAEQFFEAAGRTFLALRECGVQDYMRNLRYWHHGRRRLVIEWEGGAYGYEVAQLLQRLADDTLQSSTLDPGTFRLLRMFPGLEREPNNRCEGSPYAHVQIRGVEVQLRALSPIGQHEAVAAALAEIVGEQRARPA